MADRPGRLGGSRISIGVKERTEGDAVLVIIRIYSTFFPISRFS